MALAPAPIDHEFQVLTLFHSLHRILTCKDALQLLRSLEKGTRLFPYFRLFPHFLPLAIGCKMETIIFQ